MSAGYSLGWRARGYTSIREGGKFPTGLLSISRGVAHLLHNAMGFDGAASKQLHDMITMHVSGNWGDVDTDDWDANDAAVRDGDRILSAYYLRCEGDPGDEEREVRVWVITEADRSMTTVLLPEEYQI